jgi:hypothetical protein
MKTRFELGTIGILSGEAKMVLEKYTGDIFTQRKTYDEYYVNVTSCNVEVELEELMILSEVFVISVWMDALILSERGVNK